jgi:small subunit ribosomal protein S3Ae
MAAPKKKAVRKTAEKKWKGKDWFSISAPEWLSGSNIAVTPATDAKSVKGRVIEVSVPDMTGDQSKYYMRVGLKTGEPEGKDVGTIFHKYYCIDEYVMRIGRKGLGKVAVFVDAVTKDGWKLQVSVLTILNRRSNASIKAQVGKLAEELIVSKAKGLNHGDFIKAAMAGVFQMKIKKAASKIYPVRFTEIIKIEALKAG